MLVVFPAMIVRVSTAKSLKCKPRPTKNTDPAVSHIAVCHSASEDAEVIPVSFFASVDLACAFLDRSTHRMGNKGATRGMNGIEIGDVVNNMLVIFEAYGIIRCETLFGVSYYENIKTSCNVDIPRTPLPIRTPGYHRISNQYLQGEFIPC